MRRADRVWPLYTVMIQNLRPVSKKMLTYSEPLRVLRGILRYLKAFLFLLIVPIVGLVFLILNIFKIIAPGCMFKIATTQILSQIHLNEWKNSSNLTKMSDLKFLFSFDMFKVVKRSPLIQMLFFFLILVVCGQRS